MQQIWIQMFHSGWSREDSLDFCSSKIVGCSGSRPSKGRMELLELCVTLLLYCALCSLTVHGSSTDDRDATLVRSMQIGDEVGLDGQSRSLLSSSSAQRRHTRDAEEDAAKHRNALSVNEQPLLLANAHRKTVYKRDTSSSTTFSVNQDLLNDYHINSDLQQVMKHDKEFAVLEYIDQVEKNNSHQEKCDKTYSLQPFNLSLQQTSFDDFKAQTLSTIKFANVLSNLFREQNTPSTLYIEAFYYSYLRALLQSDPMLYGATIAFDGGQFKEDKNEDSKENGNFAVNVHRNKADSSGIAQSDLTRELYAKENIPKAKYNWFYGQRNADFSSLLWEKVCRTSESKGSANASTVLTTAKEGMWSAPYYSCDYGSSWMITYSAPFFGCKKKTGNDDGYEINFK